MAREQELDLIRRFQSGDTGSFDTLVEMFRTKGYNLAYQWTNNQEDALDILQDAFIKMYKVLSRWKPESSLFTWLYRVIINQAIDLKRRKGRIRFISTEHVADEVEKGIDLQASELDRPDVRTEAGELGMQIYDAVMKLPQRQKKIFILKHYQGLSLKEIAEILECSLGTVKSSLFQAIRKLRDELSVIRNSEVRRNG